MKKFNGRLLMIAAIVCSCLSLLSCASLQGRDPLQVTVAGFEPLQGQGMEARLNVKLRVQNPNDSPVNYDGVSLQMDVQGKTFATGVSDASGSVPRFGETVIAVPVTISAFSMVRQAIGMMEGTGTISYELKGKLSSSGVSAATFKTKGDFEMPGAMPGAQFP